MSASDGDYSEDEINIPHPTISVASPRPKGKKGTPRKTKKSGSAGRSRPNSALGPYSTSTSSRNLWMSAAINGATPGSKKKTGPLKKNALEYWTDTLRKTGVGISSESTGSMSGLKGSQTYNMAYASTSHYLRQKAGIEKTGKTMTADTAKPIPGRPAYKTPEEYYDEVIALKKQIKASNNENSTLKLRLIRVEEENLKKDKEINQLRDPSKSEEMRRVLSDGKQDSATVIYSLKQKILKLEHNLKDREAAFAKLQSDLKTTKIEELKTQLEMFYKEIVRLTNQKGDETPRPGSRAAPVKESPGKIKSLHDTVKRINEKNYALLSENKSLKEDLQKTLEKAEKNKAVQEEYEDMNKKQLLNAIGKLEKRLDKADVDSLMSDSDTRGGGGDVEGKVPLSGSMKERLAQLDQRETELLADGSKQRNLIKKLREERSRYKKACDDKDKEIRELRKECDELQDQLEDFFVKDKPLTPRPNPRRKSSAKTRTSSPGTELSRKERRDLERKAEDFNRNRAAKKIQNGWRGHKRQVEDEDEQRMAKERELDAKVETMRQTHAAKAIQKEWHKHQDFKTTQKIKKEEEAWHKGQKRKAEDFSRKRAAKQIQKHWLNHQHRKIEAETEDAAEYIQSAMRGHMSRSQKMKQLRKDYDEEEEDSELDSAAEVIQSNIRGHMSRRDRVKRLQKEQEYESELDDAVLTLQSTFRGHLSRKGQLSNGLPPSGRSQSPRNRKGSQYNKRLDSEGEEDLSDDPYANKRSLSRGSRGSKGAGRASPGRYTRKTPPPQDDDESEDDIVVSSSRSKFF